MSKGSESHVFRFVGRREGKTWHVEGDEAHHIKSVLRLSPGDAVEVMDLAGGLATGVLTAVGKSEAVVKEKSFTLTERTGRDVGLALGALKPGSVDQILPALVELGVARVAVFRQEGTAKDRINDKVTERWRRIAIAALKQCKRMYLPELVTCDGIAAFLEQAANREKIVLDPGEQRLTDVVGGTVTHTLWLIVGGERGFNAAELAAFDAAGCKRGSIGSGVLRATTAAIAAAAIVAS